MNKVVKNIVLLAAAQLCVMLLPAQNTQSNFPPYKGPFSGKTRPMDSAIDLIKAAKGRTYLCFSLSGRMQEEVVLDYTSDFGMEGLVFTKDASPDTVDIDGGERVIELAGAPTGKPLFTVGDGVMLTLKNITLNGSKNNTAPLFRVEAGGTLVLQDNVVIANNSSINDGGGVYVAAGGTLIMNGGSITRNSVLGAGGGVYVAAGGTFVKMGGVIAADNTAAVGSVVALHDKKKYRNNEAGTDFCIYFGPNTDFPDDYPDFDLYDPVKGPGGAGDDGWLPTEIPFSSHSSIPNNSIIDQIRASANQQQSSITLSSHDEEEEVSLLETSDLGAEGLTLTTATSPDNLTIDGGGHVIALTGENFNEEPLITVDDGVTLTLKNITFKGMDNNTAPLILVKSGGTLTLQYGAEVTNNHNAGSNGGGVYVEDGGTLNMDNGRIAGNSAANGGGVYINGYGTLNMNDGNITNNSATSNDGGGVYVYSYGTLSMKGGNITDNSANTNGGGAYVYDDGTLSIHGGNITSNSANAGGGVYVSSNGTLSMNDGSITNNSANTNGGGVYVSSNGTLNMYNGRITNNSATTNGGSVYINQNSTFRKTAGSVAGSVTNGVGGAVAALNGVKYRNEEAGRMVKLYFGPNTDFDDGYPNFDLKDPLPDDVGVGDTEENWVTTP